MAAQSYVSILDSYLPATKAKCGFPTSDIVIQHDNDSNHTALSRKNGRIARVSRFLLLHHSRNEQRWGVLKIYIVGATGECGCIVGFCPLHIFA